MIIWLSIRLSRFSFYLLYLQHWIVTQRVFIRIKESNYKKPKTGV